MEARKRRNVTLAEGVNCHPREWEITSRRTDTRRGEIDGLSSLFFQYANDLSQAPGRSCLSHVSRSGESFSSESDAAMNRTWNRAKTTVTSQIERIYLTYWKWKLICIKKNSVYICFHSNTAGILYKKKKIIISSSCEFYRTILSCHTCIGLIPRDRKLSFAVIRLSSRRGTKSTQWKNYSQTTDTDERKKARHRTVAH